MIVGVCSDIHYAGPAEQARGEDYEFRGIANPFVRVLLRVFRHYIWLRHPLGNNPLFETAMEQLNGVDVLVANGDFSCDTGFVGISDDAALESARICLGKLRERFRERLHATPGDHELGKFTFAGKQGGMRRESFRRMVEDLQLAPFWERRLGPHVLMGVTSSLIALPAMQNEMLAEERPFWDRARQVHLDEIRGAFARLASDERVILFCHDPTALPFLAREKAVRDRMAQVQCTIIGHLHTRLVFRLSRVLAGMPEIRRCGHSARKLSCALRDARHWNAFNVHLCPSLSGVELLKDGGFLTLKLSGDPLPNVAVKLHRLARS